MQSMLLLPLLLLAAVTAAHKYPEGYPCGVCQSVLELALDPEQPMPLASAAEQLHAHPYLFHPTAGRLTTHAHNLSATAAAVGIKGACRLAGMCATEEEWMHIAVPDDASPVDIRVTPVFGAKGYNFVRLSLITNGSTSSPPEALLTAADGSVGALNFDYSKPFQYRWTDNHLHSTLLPVTPGQPLRLEIDGVNFTLRLPAEGGSSRGIIIADPCFSGDLVGCEYSSTFHTFDRLSALLNAAMSGDDIDYWTVWGDNWYDRTGELTKRFFRQLTPGVKQTLFMSVIGNHDIWALGDGIVGVESDQYGNGHMQFYAQDSAAARNASDPDFLDFSVNPSKHLGKAKLPAIANAFFYNKIGNVGYMGYNSAYSFEETKPFFEEGCKWLGGSNVSAAFVVAHWNDAGLGCSSEMPAPKVWSELQKFDGCEQLAKDGKLLFQTGHTHANTVLEKNIGVMVAGQGMENGNANFGIPVVDTSDGHLRIYYFPVADIHGLDNYTDILKCFQENKGVSSCYHLATKWIDIDI